MSTPSFLGKRSPTLFRHLQNCPMHSQQLRHSSSKGARSIQDLFARPSWSTSTLLQSTQQAETDLPISEAQFAHLYKLSALKLPSDPTVRLQRRRELARQLHFTRLVHEVDTKGVAPLHNILASQHELKTGAGALKYEDALAFGDAAKQRFKEEDAQRAAKGEKFDKVDYTKLAKKTRGRFYVVSGGLVNAEEQ